MHRQLKELYMPENALAEQRVGKYVVDVLDGDRIYEIQTANFGALKAKLAVLLETHVVTVVYPIAAQKILVKATANGEQRRRSPKVGTILDVFDELVYLPNVLNHPNFTLEVAFVKLEELRHFDSKRAWRRRHWVVSERRLIEVERAVRYESYAELYAEISADFPAQFTTANIAQKLGISRNKAQKIAYCFRESGLLHIVGKKGNALIYAQKS